MRRGFNSRVRIRRVLSFVLVVLILVSTMATGVSASDVESSVKPPTDTVMSAVGSVLTSGLTDIVQKSEAVAEISPRGPNFVQSEVSRVLPGEGARVTLNKPSVRTVIEYDDKIMRYTTDAAAKVIVKPSSANADIWYQYDSDMDVTGTGYYKLGRHTGRVRAVDESGNVSEWTEFDFELKNTAPSAPSVDTNVDYSDYVNGFTSSCMVKVNVSITASDPDGHDGVEYEYDSGTVNSTGYYAPGSYTVKVRTVDEWGAVSNWTTAVFSVDKPSLSVRLASSTLGNANSIPGTSATVSFEGQVNTSMPYRAEFMHDSYAASVQVTTRNGETGSVVNFSSTYDAGRHMPVLKVVSLFGDEVYDGRFFIVGDASNAGGASFQDYGSGYGEAFFIDPGVFDGNVPLAHISSFSYNGGHPGHAAGGDLCYVVGTTDSGVDEIVMQIGPTATYLPSKGPSELQGLPWVTNGSVGTTSTFTCTGASDGTITFTGSEWGTRAFSWSPNKYTKMRFVFGSWHPGCCNGNTMNYTVTYKFIEGAYDGEMWESKVGVKPVVAIHKEQSVGGNDFEAVIQNAENGDEVDYKITIENIGHASAKQVAVSDPLPAGLEYIQGSANEGGSFDGSHVKWSGLTLAPGASKVLRFSTRVVDSSNSEIYKNRASLTYAEQATDSRSNEVVALKDGIPNVVIEKKQALFENGATKESFDVVPDNVITYTLKASNIGVGVAENVVITDVVPDGMELLQVSVPGVVTGNTISWPIGALDSEKSASVSFQVKVPTTLKPHTWENTATVSNEGVRNVSNTVSVDKDGQAILEIREKQKVNDAAQFTDEKRIVEADDIVTYQLEIENVGYGLARETTIFGEIPDGFELVPGSISDGGMESGGVLSWDIGNFKVGEKKVVTFQVKTPVTLKPADWTNDSYVVYLHVNSRDPATSESNVVELHKDGEAILEIEEEQRLNKSEFTKEVFPDAHADDVVTYKIKVENVGFGTSRNTKVTGYVPEGMTLVDGSVSDNGIVYVEESTPNPEPSSEPDEGESGLSALADDVPADEEEEPGISPVPSEETGDEPGTEEPSPEPSESPSPEPSEEPYGPGPSPDVDPESMSATTIEWNLEPMAPGDVRYVTFDAVVPKTENVTMWIDYADLVFGHVNSKIPVEKTSNRVVVVKDGMPGLLIDKAQRLNDRHKTRESFPSEADDVVTYYLTVENVGKGDGRYVSVTDVVPSGLKLDETSISHGGSFADGKITWNVGKMKPGAKVTLSYAMTVSQTLHPTVYENLADVFYYHTNGVEYVTHASNEVEFTKDGHPVLDIEIEQSHNSIENMTKDDLTVDAGDAVTYLITLTNKGDGVARTVKVSDIVPAGFELIPDSISMSGNQKVMVDGWIVPPQADIDVPEEPVPSPEPSESPEPEPEVTPEPEESSKPEPTDEPEVPGESSEPDVGPSESPVPDESGAELLVDFSSGVRALNDIVESDTDSYEVDDGDSGESSDVSSEPAGAPDVSEDEPGVAPGEPSDNPDDEPGDEPEEPDVKLSEEPVELPAPVIPADREPPAVANNEEDAFPDGSEIVWDVPDMVPGEQVQFTFQVKVPKTTYEHTWDNNADVIYTHTNYKTEDRAVSNTVRVWKDGMAEMGIEALQSLNGSDMQKEPLVVRAGDKVDYNLVVDNHGNGEARGVYVVTGIPRGLTLDKENISHDGKFYGNFEDIDIFGYTRMENPDLFDITTLKKIVFDTVPEWPEPAPDYPEPDPDLPDDDVSSEPEIPGESPEPSDEPVSSPEPDEDVSSNPVDEDFGGFEGDDESGGTLDSGFLVDPDGVSVPDDNELAGLMLMALDNIDDIADEATSSDEGSSETGEDTSDMASSDDENVSNSEPAGDDDGSGDESDVSGGDGDADFEQEIDGYIVWSLGNMPVGDSKTVSFGITVPETEDVTHWENFGTLVYGHSNDYFPVVKESNVLELDKDGMPDLDVQKYQKVNDGEFTQEPVDVTTDDEVTYRIVVKNVGKGVAEDVLLTDVLDSTLVLGKLDEDCLNEEGILSWSLGNMVVGDELSVEYSSTVPDVIAVTFWENTGHVKYGHTNLGDPVEEDSNTVIVTNPGVPSVTIEETHSLTEDDFVKDDLLVAKDVKVTNHITVENVGTMTAAGLVVTTEVPDGLTVVEDSISDEGKLEDGVITWKLGNLVKGGSFTVSYRTVTPEVFEPSAWESHGVVYYANNPANPDGYVPESEVADSEPGVEEDSSAESEVESGIDAQSDDLIEIDDAEVPMGDGPALTESNTVRIYTDDKPVISIEKEQASGGKTHTKDLLVLSVGDTVTYYLTVTNTGKVPSKDIVVTDTVPSGMELDKASLSDGGEVLTDGSLSWKIDRLDVGESKTFEFSVKTKDGDDGDMFENTAYAEGYITGKMTSNTVESRLAVKLEVPTGAEGFGSIAVLMGVVLCLVLTGFGVLIAIVERRKRKF